LGFERYATTQSRTIAIATGLGYSHIYNNNLYQTELEIAATESTYEIILSSDIYYDKKIRLHYTCRFTYRI
jgi:hypothetical protein